jgi:hypothetical protein
MWRTFCTVTILAALGCIGAASAGESIYQTWPAHQQRSFGADVSFVFMAPYITRVKTTLSASISKTTTSTNSGNQQNSGNSSNQAKAPTVLYADIERAEHPAQIRYQVGCNLTSAPALSKVTVTGAEPGDFNTPAATPAKVVSVTAEQIIISNPSSTAPSASNLPKYKMGGKMTDEKGQPITDTGGNKLDCSITAAVFLQPVQIEYWVSCDLTSVLHEGDPVMVSGMAPQDYDISTPATAVNVKPGLLVVSYVLTATPSQPNGKGGVIKARSFENCPTTGDAFTVALTVTPIPLSRGYLYLRRNAFFDDNVDFSVDSNGMPSNSDTSSPQEITAILTELAQTAGAAGLNLLHEGADLTAMIRGTELKIKDAQQALVTKDHRTADFLKRVKDDLKQLKDELSDHQAQLRALESQLNSQRRAICSKAITDLVKSQPFYDTIEFEQISDGLEIDGTASKATFQFEKPAKASILPKGSVPGGSSIVWSIPVGKVPESDGTVDAVEITLTLKTRFTSYGQEVDDTKERWIRNGFVAFFPVPARAEIDCVVTRENNKSNTVLLAAPTVVNLYTESHLLNPQRDFFTNPHDTITFTSGMITNHKFTGQSAAKTVIDTITAPLRSIMPSTTVTQTVTVAPTGKTTTNTTTTAPPKGP